jgi:hypothetical protein
MDHPEITYATPDTDIDHVITSSADIAAWVRATARHHRIAFTAGPVDVFADAVSRLSDAGVLLDSVEQELLAIERAGIVTGRQGVLLHAAYLRQKR